MRAESQASIKSVLQTMSELKLKLKNLSSIEMTDKF